MKRELVILFLYLGLMTGWGQVGNSIPIMQPPDSLARVAKNVDLLYQLLLERTEDRLLEELELGSEGVENSEDSHEELIEDYLFYLENPVNINSDEVLHLEEIGLLNAFQVKALKQYQRQFGDLIFAEELLMIDDFNETTIAVISPLVYFGKSEFTQNRNPPAMGMYNASREMRDRAQEVAEEVLGR